MFYALVTTKVKVMANPLLIHKHYLRLGFPCLH